MSLLLYQLGDPGDEVVAADVGVGAYDAPLAVDEDRGGDAADVEAGGRQDSSTWATFEDGHYEMRFCDAVVLSARENRWVRLDEIGG